MTMLFGGINDNNSAIIEILPQTGQSRLIYYILLVLIALILICIAIVLLKKDKSRDENEYENINVEDLKITKEETGEDNEEDRQDT